MVDEVNRSDNMNDIIIFCGFIKQYTTAFTLYGHQKNKTDSQANYHNFNDNTNVMSTFTHHFSH